MMRGRAVTCDPPCSWQRDVLFVVSALVLLLVAPDEEPTDETARVRTLRLHAGPTGLNLVGTF